MISVSPALLYFSAASISELAASSGVAKVLRPEVDLVCAPAPDTKISTKVISRAAAKMVVRSLCPGKFEVDEFAIALSMFMIIYLLRPPPRPPPPRIPPPPPRLPPPYPPRLPPQLPMLEAPRLLLERA